MSVKTVKAWAVVEENGELAEANGGDLFICDSKSCAEEYCTTEGERVVRVIVRVEEN